MPFQSFQSGCGTCNASTDYPDIYYSQNPTLAASSVPPGPGQVGAGKKKRSTKVGKKKSTTKVGKKKSTTKVGKKKSTKKRSMHGGASESSFQLDDQFIRDNLGISFETVGGVRNLSTLNNIPRLNSLENQEQTQLTNRQMEFLIDYLEINGRIRGIQHSIENIDGMICVELKHINDDSDRTRYVICRINRNHQIEYCLLYDRPPLFGATPSLKTHITHLSMIHPDSDAINGIINGFIQKVGPKPAAPALPPRSHNMRGGATYMPPQFYKGGMLDSLRTGTMAGYDAMEGKYALVGAGKKKRVVKKKTTGKKSTKKGVKKVSKKKTSKKVAPSSWKFW